MSQEQHKGDNHQGKTRKKGRRHFKGGGGNTSGVLGFFFLEPALVFFFLVQSRKCLANMKRTVSTWKV